MDFETIKLWKDGTDETLLFRVLDDDEAVKPAMLVIPGGGYACVCHDAYSARQAVEHDNLNVLCLGARIIGPALAEELVKQFLGATFMTGTRHEARLQKVIAFENAHFK